jgi:hypothetical protein
LAPWLDGQIRQAIEVAPAVEIPAEPDNSSDSSETDQGSGAQQQREPDTEDALVASAAPAAPAGLSAAGVEAAVTGMWAVRALELAGKRRVNTRDRAQHDRLRGIPAHRYHRVMGAVAEGEVGRLIRGWDDSLEDDVLAGIGVDPERLRAQVFAQAVRELTSPIIDGQVV